MIGTLLLVAGMVFKNQGAILSGLGTIIFSALMAVFAYLTGSPAAVAVKSLPGMAESLISRHEDVAAVAMYLQIPAGLLAVLSFYSILKKENSARFLVIITLVLSVASSAGMICTGLTGGQIRHSEFRNADSNKYIVNYQYDEVGED